jgi:hypothetical protein
MCGTTHWAIFLTNSSGRPAWLSPCEGAGWRGSSTAGLLTRRSRRLKNPIKKNFKKKPETRFLQDFETRLSAKIFPPKIFPPKISNRELNVCERVSQIFFMSVFQSRRIFFQHALGYSWRSTFLQRRRLQLTVVGLAPGHPGSNGRPRPI